jgi:hypothetical protein
MTDKNGSLDTEALQDLFRDLDSVSECMFPDFGYEGFTVPWRVDRHHQESQLWQAAQQFQVDVTVHSDAMKENQRHAAAPDRHADATTVTELDQVMGEKDTSPRRYLRCPAWLLRRYLGHRGYLIPSSFLGVVVELTGKACLR